ncbi:hypothetical protein HanRHA438_Chr00c29g0854921 [Helianthus annuus]|nr:hypothetical protein HanRHA438_Chr00c29g0854921 [Helianthus annuus]
MVFVVIYGDGLTTWSALISGVLTGKCSSWWYLGDLLLNQCQLNLVFSLQLASCYVVFFFL